MNNTQLYLSIGIPTLTVILAWLSSRSDSNRLNDKVDKLAESVRREMTDLRIDLNKDTDKLGESIRNEMIAFRREVHQDLILLHERVVKVETQQNA